MPAGDSHSIESTSRQAAHDCEHRLWQALLCESDDTHTNDKNDENDDSADAAEEIMAQHIEPDCVVVNPLLHPDHAFEALTAASAPYTLAAALARHVRSGRKSGSGSSWRWTSYRVHEADPAVATAQVEMMGVQIMYKVTVVRERRQRRHHHRHHRHRHGKGEDEGKGEDGEEEGDGEGAEAGEKTLQAVDAFCASTWRQGVGGDWKLCAQHLVPV